MVHVCNVPPTSSLSDIGILFAKAGLHHPFSFRVSESVVAVQLDTEAAVEAALALSGSILTPPKVGQINIPGQVIEVIQAAPATHAPTALFWPFEAPDCKPCIEKAREASAGFCQSQLCLFVLPKRVLLLSYYFFFGQIRLCPSWRPTVRPPWLAGWKTPRVMSLGELKWFGMNWILQIPFYLCWCNCFILLAFDAFCTASMKAMMDDVVRAGQEARRLELFCWHIANIYGSLNSIENICSYTQIWFDSADHYFSVVT